MSGNSSRTMVGRAPAGPNEEHELLIRLAQALAKARALDVEDRDVVYAVTDLLDRANYVLESNVDVTILAGEPGTFVNAHKYDVTKKRPDLADELVKGFAARALAGVRINAALDQAEVRAFLTAWKLPPEGSPKEARSRLREVWDGERMGRGLSGDSPLELVPIPATGGLPLPDGAADLPAYEGPDESDEAAVAEAPPKAPTKPLDPQRAGLAALLANRPANRDPEEHPPDSDGGRTAIRRSGDVIEEDRRDAARAKKKGDSRVVPPDADGGRTAVRRAGDVFEEDRSAAAQARARPGDSKANWVDEKKPGPGQSWLSKDDSESWVKEDSKDDDASASEDYKSAFQALASETQARTAAEVAGASDIEREAGSTAVRNVADVIPEDAVAREAGSTAVRQVKDLIPEDLGNEDEESPKSATGVQWVDVPRPMPVDASRVASGQPVQLDDLSPDAARASLVYSRLVARVARTLEAPPAAHDRAVAAVRRAVVEMLTGLAQTAFEDRLVALTAYPVEPDVARARHGANVAVLTALAGRSCGLSRVALADLTVAAALHDEGDVESFGKADRWPQGLVRALSGAASDLALLRATLGYERAGPRGAVARPAPGSQKPRIESRLVACACAFDDAVTGAADRGPARPDVALARLAQTGHDAVAARSLAAALGKYPRGALVVLAPSGQLAVVLACGGRRGDRPRIRIFADAQGHPVEPREVELASAPDVDIERVEDGARLGVDPLAHLVAWG